MKRINISQIDALFASGIYPIEFLFFYKNGIKTAKVRAALKKLVSAFWPMFGAYDAGAICFEGYCEEACFEEEASQKAFDRQASPNDIHQAYCRALPADLKRLFLFKIIQYQNGTVLIPKLNHLAGDGYSYFYFLSLLAAMAQKSYFPFKKQIIRHAFKPHHRRTILKDFQMPDISLPPLRERDSLTIKFEKVSRNSIRDRIRTIAANAGHSVSANDVLSAMIIKKSVAMQLEQFGATAQLTMPIDVRRKIKEYGSKFFGNGLQFSVMEFTAADLKQWDTNEVAVRIRKAMPVINKETYLVFLAAIEAMIDNKQIDQLRIFDPERGCLVTNLSKMPINRLDFGSGNPDLVFPLTIAKNSAAILADQDNFILRLAY
jgi:hypothetical protein